MKKENQFIAIGIVSILTLGLVLWGGIYLVSLDQTPESSSPESSQSDLKPDVVKNITVDTKNILSGEIVSKTENQLTIKTRDNQEKNVVLSDDTIIQTQSEVGDPAKIEDIDSVSKTIPVNEIPSNAQVEVTCTSIDSCTAERVFVSTYTIKTDNFDLNLPKTIEEIEKS